MMIIGLICVLAGYLAAASGFDIETQGGSTSFTISMSGSDLGHSIYIAQDAACTDSDWSGDGGNPRITSSFSGGTTSVEVADISCGLVDTNPESFEGSHDPPIRSVGVFRAHDDPTDDRNAGGCQDTSHCNTDDVNSYCIPQCRTLEGNYEISCGSACWVVDAGEELGEAAGGIMAMMGLLIVCFILLGVGDLLLCIACCCCCQGPDKVPGGGGPVQGMVVGQPVGSA